MKKSNAQKIKRFRFLSTVGARLVAVLLWTMLLVLPTPSMGGVRKETHAPQNRLIGYSSSTTEATYAYDALDRRIAKTVDGVTEAFVYDAWGRGSTSNEVVLDFTDGALTRRWLHGPGVDEPLAFYAISGAGGTGYDLQADRQGSILRVVDPATGTVVAEYEYQAFGLRNTTGLLSQRYAFTGREADDESGLLYYRARHYDPATGMFLQRDPIGFAAGDLNLYAYVWNDPQNWTDPSGLKATAENGMLTGAVSGAALGGLFSGIRMLAMQIAKQILLSVANGSGDDAGTGVGAGAGTGPGDPGCEPNDPGCEDQEQNGKDANRVGKTEANDFAKDAGFEDMHDLKDAFGLGSESDILFNSRTGEFFLGQVTAPGPGRS